MAKKSRPQDFVRTWIEIDRRSLFFNLKYFQKLASSSEMIVMIKSNAYGHGLALIASALTNYKSSKTNNKLWFGVDSITEATRLRKEGIKNRILVLGYTLPGRLQEAVLQNIIVTISHFEGLKILGRLKQKPQFHIKIDTGMHRQGFQESDMRRLISELKKYSLTPQGVYSHLAMPPNNKFSQKQIQIFENCVRVLKNAGVYPEYIHFNKTEGIVRFPKSRYEVVRLGIGLYGYYPASEVQLKPILTWKTIIAEVKNVPKGDYISYDLTEKLKRDSIIAILPIGYWHGFDRGLSSIGDVLVYGTRCKVLGRVTMDMTIIDVTHLKNKVKVGDEVVIIGRQMKEVITADNMAQKIGTTAYEVLTRINPLIFKLIK
jgi:alanine racemase